MAVDLLASLRSLRWFTVFRTFGSNHATLVGLLVDWWICSAPETRWALEGGPAYISNPGGPRGGHCDAILGEGELSRGVVEVECSRYEETIAKLGRFLQSERLGLRSLEFAVFLAYQWQAIGRGRDRRFGRLPVERFVELGTAVTEHSPGKRLVILALEKTFELPYSDPRALGGYYWGRPIRVQGALLQDGRALDRSEWACDTPVR